MEQPSGAWKLRTVQSPSSGRYALEDSGDDAARLSFCSGT